MVVNARTTEFTFYKSVRDSALKNNVPLRDVKKSILNCQTVNGLLFIPYKGIFK